MTLNFPSPLALKVFYTARGRSHVLNVYVRPSAGFPFVAGLDADQYEFANGNGTNTTDFPNLAATLVDGNGIDEDLLPTTSRGGIKHHLTPTDSVERVELWYYPPASNDGLFLSAVAFDSVGDTGNLDTPVPAAQMTITFRTSEGGIMRFQMMEPATANTTARYTFATAPNRIKTLINTVLDLNYPFIGKDGGRPIAFLRANMTQNEKLYRKVYRS